jgi:hypothetical protein
MPVFAFENFADVIGMKSNATPNSNGSRTLRRILIMIVFDTTGAVFY